MAATGSIPINCPDCAARYDVPVSVTTEGAVKILTDTMMDSFTDHVMADPVNHPTFAVPPEDGEASDG